MANTDKIWLVLLLTFAVAATSCVQQSVATVQVAPAPAFVSDNPQAIYAADPNDPWNRIFRALFTRTVKARVSDAFPEGAPFEPFHVRMGNFPIRLSTEKLSRTELGDRAIEPLYPTFFTAEGPALVLREQFTELSTALREAIDEAKNRSAIERALMQADIWAAYDIIYVTELGSGYDIPNRRATLLKLLRQFIQKLALSSDEIKSLKSNYQPGGKLPDLFSSESGWLEIELLPDRSHDHAARFRRAARVFVKPRTKPSDPGQFVESLKHHQHLDQIEAVGLVVQNLLIDTSGRIIPSPVFIDVQFRFFRIDPHTGKISANAQQFELSRRKLVTDPTSGGLVEYPETSPAYLAAAGNDYDFANPTNEADVAVVVPLRKRCEQCHNSSLARIATYAIHYIPPVPTTRVLKPSDQERAFYVAKQKGEREDFKSLSATP